jgi:cold shock CspA family protein
MEAIKAKIRWFDTVSGQGLVNLPNGESIYMHWSALLDTRNGKRGFVVSEEIEAELLEIGANIKGADCLVTVTRDSHYSAIDTCVML